MQYFVGYFRTGCDCSCTPSCVLYQDCCPDYYKTMGYIPKSGIQMGLVNCVHTISSLKTDKKVSKVSMDLSFQFDLPLIYIVKNNTPMKDPL